MDDKEIIRKLYAEVDCHGCGKWGHRRGKCEEIRKLSKKLKRDVARVLTNEYNKRKRDKGNMKVEDYDMKYYGTRDPFHQPTRASLRAGKAYGSRRGRGRGFGRGRSRGRGRGSRGRGSRGRGRGKKQRYRTNNNVNNVQQEQDKYDESENGNDFEDHTVSFVHNTDHRNRNYNDSRQSHTRRHVELPQQPTKKQKKKKKKHKNKERDRA